MFSDGLIAFIVALGAGTWTYNRLMKSTNRVPNSLIGGAVVGVVGLIIIYTLLKYLLHW